MRCPKPSTGICSPTRRVVGMGRHGSGRGGSSPAFPAGHAGTPRPHPAGRPTDWSAPWPGTCRAIVTRTWETETATGAAAARRPAGTSMLAQPARLSAPARLASGSWSDHTTTLAVLFTGSPGGDLVLPVRLPQGAGQGAQLAHCPGNPDIWHKIDLVRVGDRKAPGGWRSYPHLLVHQGGYQAAARRARRGEIRPARRAGVDANVSNLSVASFPDDEPGRLVAERIGCTAEQQTAADRAATKERARQQAVDRSRRTTTADHYAPSVRPHKRAQRRADNGLAARQSTSPGGPRHARADAVPLRAYRHDTLSRGYQRTRADHAAASRSASPATQARAGQVTARIVAAHGNTITVEDTNISTWARWWGKRIALFSPGMLVAALGRECQTAGGALSRAGTRSTALSQHCLCGARVSKTLAQRTHHCPRCGLRGDRDIVSAALAACVTLPNPDDPRTARVDYRLAHTLQRVWQASQWPCVKPRIVVAVSAGLGGLGGGRGCRRCCSASSAR